MAKEELRRLANHDALTSLFNRRVFEEELRRVLELGERRGHQVALILLDLDDFKRINDTLGHRVGDQVLQKVAKRLESVLRRSDFLARIGGDEFAIVVDDYRDLDEIGTLIRRLQRAMEERISVESFNLRISLSIGVALYPRHGKTIETLLRAADMALYEAKRNGKNRYAFFSRDSKRLIEKIQLEMELAEAMDREALELFYQPQIDCRSGELCGVEALIRWRHPRRGLLGPEEFLSLAGESGLLYRIDQYVLETVLTSMQRWHERGIACPSVSVNLSRALFHHQEFLPYLQKLSRRYRGCFTKLELELNEEILVESDGYASRLAEEIKAMGLRLCIDDFGIGYSCLRQLKRLNIDKIKIDRSLIQEIGDADSRAVIEAIVSMFRSLGLKVLAEGVESRQQRDLLEEMGCDAIQGFLVTRPLSEADFIRKWLLPSIAS